MGQPGHRLTGHHALSSSSVEPPSLAYPCYLPASCGWCTPRSRGSGWNSCWSQAPSTSLGTAQPRSPHPTRNSSDAHPPHMLRTLSYSALPADAIVSSPPPPRAPPTRQPALRRGCPQPTQPEPVFSCRGSARYDFSHEILRDEESFFGGRRVPRGRRISVICRSLPEEMGPGEPGQPPPAC